MIFSCVLAMFGCGGGSSGSAEGGQGPVDVSGVIQKGPFTVGSTIVLAPLGVNLEQHQQTYLAAITDDFGSFLVENVAPSPYVEALATGFYFDEVGGELSEAQLSLRALSENAKGGTLNVNVLTALAHYRMRHLLTAGGLNFALASQQATGEVLEVFHIPADDVVPFTQMDLSGSDDNTAILIAVSAILQADHPSVALLSERINQLALDLEMDGVVNDAVLLATLRTNAMMLDCSEVADNLVSRYAQLGRDIVCPDFWAFVDSDGDGEINRTDPPGETYEVPGDYASIQAALDDAPSVYGTTTIVVSPGTYLENVDFLGKQVILRSTDPSDPAVVASTVIDGGEQGRAVTMSSDSWRSQKLSGFTIRNSGGYFQTVFVTGGSPEISNCAITGWRGLFLSESNAVVRDCVVANCRDDGVIVSGGGPTIENTEISGNARVGIMISMGAPLISNCTIRGNQDGGMVADFSRATIRGCLIADNTTIHVGTVRVTGGPDSDVIFERTTFTGNSDLALYVALEGRATVRNCLVVNNAAGIRVFRYSDLTLINSTLADNGQWAPLQVDYVSTARVFNSILWNGIEGDGVIIDRESHATITYSDVSGGDPADIDDSDGIDPFPGEGNVLADPLLTGPAYELGAGSPCIDAGAASDPSGELTAPLVDIDGDARPNGGGYDMGAQEF